MYQCLADWAAVLAKTVELQEKKWIAVKERGGGARGGVMGTAKFCLEEKLAMHLRDS